MASLFPLPSVVNNDNPNPKKYTAKGRYHSNLLVVLIAMDVLGVFVMLMGLRQQFHQQGVLPETIDGPYAGVMMVIAGVMLTLPFFIWSFKASFRPFGTLNK